MMKIAYHIGVHKNFEQLIDLIDALWTPEDLFLIHIDKKSGDDFAGRLRTHINDTGRESNILLQDRIRVTWGCPSILNFHYLGLRQLVHTEKDWKYYVNLSGQDFPLKNPIELKEFLSKDPRMNYIEVRDASQWNLIKSRTGKFHVTIGGRVRNTHIPRKQPADIDFYGGSSYCCLSRDFCEYIARSDLGERLIKFLRFAKLPEEIFFQTMLMNSRFRGEFVNDNLRYIKWPEGGASHPQILDSGEYRGLMQNGCFFARKFDERIDRKIIKRLKKEILEPR